MDTEEEIINILIEHYQTCNGRPTPLKALKKHFGKKFKFETLGLGKFSPWLQKNSYKFQVEKIANDFLTDIDIKEITEDELLDVVTEYFNKSEMFDHRRHVLVHLRKIYGEHSFADFGYGIFPEFLRRHKLNMGIRNLC